jgi:hypothetical protein
MDYSLVSKELIQYLEEMFPNVLPPKGTTEVELLFLQGQMSVVDRLKQLYEDDHVLGQNT